MGHYKVLSEKGFPALILVPAGPQVLVCMQKLLSTMFYSAWHRNDPPNASTSRCAQELLRIVEANLTGVQLLDAEELKMKRVEYLEQSLEKKRLISLAPNYTCIKCPSFKQHVRICAFYLDI